MFTKEVRSDGAAPIPMPERPRTDSHASGPSVIGADLTITGNLSCAGSIQIDGKVEGDIDSRTLTIGESADVNGVLSAENVTVCGNVQGEIRSHSVQLTKSARVTGDIAHQSLAVEAGASIEGYLRRMESQASVQQLHAQRPANGGAAQPKAPETGTGGEDAGF